MFSKSLSVWLAGWMIVASVVPYAQAKIDSRGAHASRVKAAIQRLGTGESARLQVELCDDTSSPDSLSKLATINSSCMTQRLARVPKLPILR